MGRSAKSKPIPIGRYRVLIPVLALFEEDGCHVARMVPRGSIVHIESTVSSNDPLTDVVWEGKSVMMFTQELLSFAEPACNSNSISAEG
jgi:hypothetical protein